MSIHPPPLDRAPRPEDREGCRNLHHEEVPMRRVRQLVCLVITHHWKRERRADGTVLLTCRTCVKVDAVDSDTGGRGMGWASSG